MTMPDLLPCPFCGDSAQVQDEIMRGGHMVYGCVTETCAGHRIIHCADDAEANDTAIEKWNTRPCLSNALNSEKQESLSAQSCTQTYNPETHILIAREDVPDNLAYWIDRYHKPDCLKNLSPLIKAASLLAQKAGE